MDCLTLAELDACHKASAIVPSGVEITRSLIDSSGVFCWEPHDRERVFESDIRAISTEELPMRGG